jgi:hypothetical protein
LLDHRKLFPAGTVLAKNEKGTSLFIYGKEGGKPRMLASLAMQTGKKHRFVGVPDIAGDCGDRVVNYDNYHPDHVKAQQANHDANKEFAVHKDFEQADTVAIAAPGRIPYQDIERVQKLNIPIVAVSRAADSHFLPNYVVVSDYTVHQPPFFNAEGITAVLCTHVHPSLRDCGWKDVTWFTHLPKKMDGIPYSPATEGVITDALWFAIKGLGAKKVIMLGVEQPATNTNYFWEGVFLQAHCFWYSKHDIEIWNCTPASSVVAGVKLGTLEEACQ